MFVVHGFEQPECFLSKVVELSSTFGGCNEPKRSHSSVVAVVLQRVQGPNWKRNARVSCFSPTR